MNTFELIQAAIQQKQQVHATFRNHRRQLCPHVLGYKHNVAHCLFYQYGGSSGRGLSRNPAQNWRCIPINELKDITIEDGEWHSGGNYNIVQSCVDEVVEKI